MRSSFHFEKTVTDLRHPRISFFFVHFAKISFHKPAYPLWISFFASLWKTFLINPRPPVDFIFQSEAKNAIRGGERYMKNVFKVKQKMNFAGGSRIYENYFFKVKQKRIPRGERVYEKLCFQIKQKIKSAGGRGGPGSVPAFFSNDKWNLRGGGGSRVYWISKK